MKLGSIGSEERMYTKGNVAIVSKSGGMCGETALLLSQNKIGQSICVGIGGDQILGTSFTDMFEILEKDKDTKVIVMYGEIGGQYEEEAAKMIKKMNTPVVAFISGQFAEKVGREVAMGHAGAILEKGSGSAAQKKKVLKNAGVYVANYHDEIVDIVKKLV
jgi:succinyl-CoA synthetase alpha subunit